MRRATFFYILLVMTAIASGCIAGTGNPAPSMGIPDTPATGSPVISGGRALAIAVNADDIATPYPEAKELLIRGLTSSTQYARYNESLEYFDKALAIDPGFTDAWCAKGVALHNLKRYDEAVTCYDRALALDPQNAAVWFLKGTAFDDSGRLTEAAGCYKKAMEIDPRHGVR